MVGLPSTDLSREKACSQTEVLRRICEPLGKGKKTFRLPASTPITEDDLVAANEFRRALGEFQSWRKDIVNGEAEPCDPRGFAFIFKEAMQQKGSCRPASTMLDCFQDDVLGTVPQHIVCRFKCAYEDLFQIAAARRTDYTSGVAVRITPRLPGRPVLLQHCSVADNDCPAATPLDLDDLHETLARFRSQLIDSCVESEESEEHNGNDEDISVVMSRERMNEEYMFRLARSKDFGPKNCVI